MHLENIKIRQCSHDNLSAIADICYITGFMGENLIGSGKFDDKTLFSYLFCMYYPLYEIDNCFVAYDDMTCKVIGYIIGSRNTIKQEKRFIQKMVPRIALRMFTYTLFFYTESFKAVLFFIKNLELKDIKKEIYKKYPAHCHMNILPQYQKRGIGSKLLNAFEDYMSDKEISGIHIWASNKNVKAVPFYKKHGYEIIYERENKVWNGIEGYKDIIFGKKVI